MLEIVISRKTKQKIQKINKDLLVRSILCLNIIKKIVSEKC